MIAAIVGHSLWFLNFVHVMAGVLWTGIDLFMGFVIGPVLRRVSFETRRTMIAGIMPRTLLLNLLLSLRLLSLTRLSGEGRVRAGIE